MTPERTTDTSLQDRVVVVTGGGGGIGAAVTRRLAEAGATIVLAEIDAELAHETVNAVVAGGGQASAVVGDIRAPEVVSELIGAAAAASGGRIDVLVNNVGDYRPVGRFVHSTEQAWAELHEINLLHVFRCTHAVLPFMLGRRSGSIVNVSTVEAFRGIPNNAVYSAYKAGVVAFTRSLAVEVAKDGVRVNCIAPDLADTLQTPAELMLSGRDPANIPMWVPLGRFGRPDDYAEVVHFLAGDAARFITGTTIPVDGGTLAASGWYRRASGRGWTNLPDRP